MRGGDIIPADKLDIKSIISMQDILSLYNIEPDRHGKFLCPFHDDTKPSASIKGDIFTCWTCGATGDIFKFVQLMQNCTFQEALNIICNEFRIENGTEISTSQRKTIRERQKQAKERLKQKEYGIYAYNRLCAYRRYLAGQSGYDPEKFNNLGYVEYLLDLYLSNVEKLAIDFPNIDGWLRSKHKSAL